MRSSVIRRAPSTWPLWPLVAFLAVFLVYPVVQVLSVSAADGEGSPSLVHYARLFSSSVYLRVLATTFEISAWTTVLCVLIGYPVAYLLANASNRRRGLLAVFVLLPFWTSFLVRTFAWIILLGRQGLLNTLFLDLGLTEKALPLMYNYGGVLVGMTHALLPIAILTMSSVMEGIPGDLTRAAGTMGARPAEAFLRVYLPLSMPGVAAAGLTVFITALGFFITPALLGGPRETMISQVIIDNVQGLLNWGFAGALAMLLLVATLVVFVVYDRLVGLSTLSGERRHVPVKAGSGRVMRVVFDVVGRGLDAIARLRDAVLPRRAAPGRARLTWIFAILVLAVLGLPSLVVIPISFTESNFLEWPPHGFTWKWYGAFFDSPMWLAAAWRSLWVGVAASGLATLIGAPAAFVLAKRAFLLRGPAMVLVLAPMILPRMIIALSLFYFFAQIGLVGSGVGLVLGHTVLAVPYVVITVMAVLKSHDDRLELAAGTLGARRLQTLWHITIPLIRAGLVSAFLFAFVVSFDELTVALFVTGGLSATLPKMMWDDALLKVSPMLAAVSTIVLVAVTAMVFAGEATRRRSAGRTLGER